CRISPHGPTSTKFVDKDERPSCAGSGRSVLVDSLGRPTLSNLTVPFLAPAEADAAHAVAAGADAVALPGRGVRDHAAGKALFEWAPLDLVDGPGPAGPEHEDAPAPARAARPASETQVAVVPGDLVLGVWRELDQVDAPDLRDGPVEPVGLVHCESAH